MRIISGVICRRPARISPPARAALALWVEHVVEGGEKKVVPLRA
jgi:hypothetical protein